MEKRKILACELENIGVLFLGRTGEHEATTFVFDASDWLRGYADGAIGLTVKRPDGLTYPAQAGEAGADGTLTWKPTIDDLAIAGAGELELTITAGGKVKKSARCPTRIDASMEQNGDAPTGTEPGWVTQLFEALPNIENASESIAAANAAAEAANAAAARSPYIDEKTKNWMIWDAGKGAYVDTGISSVGNDFRILGIYETYDVLVSSVIAPAQGDHYDVGPDEDGLYTLYMYDSEKGWVNKGVMTGGTGSGTVTGVMIGDQTYQPNEQGVVELPEMGGALSSNGTAADASKLGGKAPEYYLQPRNLLDNSDFTNPVNQRGQTSYTGAEYGIDRWAGNGSACGVDVSDECITLKTTATTSFLFQRIPDGVIKEGATYTIALKALGGAVGVASGVASVGMGASVRVFDIADEQGEVANFRMEYNSNEGLYRVSIGTSSTNGVKLEWAALYEGAYTADTLPPYVPKGYVTELMECQRRCVPMYGYARYRASRVLDDYLYFEIPLPVIMAKTPEISNTKNTIGVGRITGNATNDYTFGVSNMNATSVQIRAEKAGHGLTDAYIVFEGTTSEDGAFLLAEL